VRWAGASALTLTALAGLWAGLRFRSRNNPNSALELVGWWFLAGVGGLIIGGGIFGLWITTR
jgi:hypothetical protein